MSNLIRWEPMQEMVTLREAMDRLFADAFTQPFGRSAGSHFPASRIVAMSFCEPRS